jgi:hypothetical protein
MNADDRDSRRLVARLLRLGRVNRSRPIQFSLQSALLAVTAFCIVTWLIQNLARNLFAQIPLVAQLLLAHLCAIVVGGLIFSAGAKWYFGGGILGTVLASPALLYVFVHDLEEVPFLTVWYALFIFAVSATLGGAVWWLINDRDGMAAAHFAAFAVGIVSIIALLAA